MTEAERVRRREQKLRLRERRPWRCAALLPGTRRRCCLPAGHTGEHEAVVAVRDDGPAFERWPGDTVDGSHDQGGQHGMA